MGLPIVSYSTHGTWRSEFLSLISFVRVDKQCVRTGFYMRFHSFVSSTPVYFLSISQQQTRTLGNPPGPVPRGRIVRAPDVTTTTPCLRPRDVVKAVAHACGRARVPIWMYTYPGPRYPTTYDRHAYNAAASVLPNARLVGVPREKNGCSLGNHALLVRGVWHTRHPRIIDQASTIRPE